MTKAALVSQCPGLQDYWTKLVLSNATTLVAQCPGLQGHSDKDCTYVLQD